MKKLKRILAAPFFHLYVQSKRTAVYKGALKKPHRWYRRPLDGCVCSNGTPYAAYYKRGVVNKLAVYFSGGGACWDEHTAARPNTLTSMLDGVPGYYFPDLPPYLDLLLGGILAEKPDARNPFADWNFVYIPYASADFHVGGSDFPYTGVDGKARILHHHGAQNMKAALDALPEAFAKPEQLLIAGESAGAFGCLAHAPAVAARFPACGDVTVYADGAQLCATGGFWRNVVGGVWKADKSLVNCLGDEGQLAADWLRRAAQAMGGGTRFLHSNSRFDETLATFQNKLNHDEYSLSPAAIAEYHATLAAVTRGLADELPNYRYFICNHDYKADAGTTSHTTSRWAPRFFDAYADGVTLAQWLAKAVAGEMVDNVGCNLL